MRWIWIDKFLEFRSGQFARAIKNLTLAEEHLHDHFPGLPGDAGLADHRGAGPDRRDPGRRGGGFAEKVVLAKIPRAEFYGVACAGDQLIYEVTLTDLRSEGAVVDAKAFLDGELLADAEIVFAHLDNSRANQIFGPKNFVFTQQLLGVLDLAKAQQRAREADQTSRRGGRVQRTAPRVAAGHLTRHHAGRIGARSPSRPERISRTVAKNLRVASSLCRRDRSFEAIISEAVRLE